MSKKHSHSLQALIEQTSGLLRREVKKKHKYSTNASSNARRFAPQVAKIAQLLRKNLPWKKKK